jgi:hypothetical protein
MRSIGLPLFDTVSQGYTMLLLIADLFLRTSQPGGKNLLSSPDNGRVIKKEMNHAGMYLYEHNSDTGRETENCGREHLRALP